MGKIRIALDGGEFVEVSAVLIEVPAKPDDDCTCTLTFNEVGLVQDLYDRSPEEACIRTSYMNWEEFLPAIEEF